MDRASRARFRVWSDGLAILASITAIGFAIWGTPMMVSEGEEYVGGSRGVGPDIGWIAYAVAGALGLAGVFLAQRPGRRRLGQMLLGGAGVVMLLTLLVMRQFDAYAIATKLLPGLIMLATAPFLGPMAEADVG